MITAHLMRIVSKADHEELFEQMLFAALQGKESMFVLEKDLSPGDYRMLRSLGYEFKHYPDICEVKISWTDPVAAEPVRNHHVND